MGTTAYIFISISAVSLVSFAGIAAFSMREEMMKKMLFILVGLAAGTLIGDAVIHLIPEALEKIGDERAFGLALLTGVVVFFILEKYLRWHHAHHGAEEEHEMEEALHHPKHLAPMVLLADSIHNLLDGAVIAAGFLISPIVGFATVVAVFLHEIPQEIADYALLVHSGFSRTKALFFNFLSALTAFLGAGFLLLLSSSFELIGAFAGAFTAGAFIYIAATDLIPELHKTRGVMRGAIELGAFIVGIALMLLLTFLEV
ncbi:MAG: ZIP family metal transporter [Candidatus Pacebacteria bacterium]|nr:ZIP family metal transporter [Candidatus Paceibacterota bacterium]MBP9832285.1 ZIP family metal transporter [Candidatus Paceibacterota bacterium]